MADITKSVRLTLEDATWQALHNWTELIRRDARARGMKEGVREEAIIASIIRMAILDNSNELCDRLDTARLEHLKKGLLGLVCAETATASITMDDFPSAANDG